MKGTLTLADGGSLAYESFGSGPPLLLVSGLGGVSAFWLNFAKACAPFFNVVLHDHRGTGASSRCDRPYSIESMAQDVRALCAHLELQRPLYVGHSTGGAIGQHLAAFKELEIRALVLSATFARPCRYFQRLFGSRLQVLEQMGMDAYREQASLLLYPPYWLAEHAPAIGSAQPHPLDAEITRRRIHAVLQHDMVERLADIDCSTLVIAARDDIVTPDYHSVQLAQGIATAELTILPRGGHYLPHTEPEPYFRHVVNFLRSHA